MELQINLLIKTTKRGWGWQKHHLIVISFTSFILFSVRIKRVVKIDGKRPYNKKLSCYYCGKLLHHRIQKPLENSHNNELLVAQATAKISIKERETFDASLIRERWLLQAQKEKAPGTLRSYVVLSRYSYFFTSKICVFLSVF